MILLFDYNLAYLRWCRIENGSFIEDKCRFSSTWPAAVEKNIGGFDKIKTIVYFLHHGGEYIKKPVNSLTPSVLRKVRQSIKFLPEYNDLVFKIASYWIKKLPKVSHILLCDTAFFNNLPPEAANYAVPCQFRKKGIKRYGGFGLSHSWAFRKTAPLINSSQKKIVSIYLGEHTNLAAIQDANPIETSIGFTPVEGILSATHCGNIDPTIIFNLHAKGMSLARMNQILSRESGLGALLGKKTSISRVINEKSSFKKIAARQLYCYNIIKYIGSFISLLGGIDALVFFSEKPESFMQFILEICQQFNFLGLKFRSSAKEESGFLNLTKDASSIKAFCLRYNKWEVMVENIINKRRLKW